jgi:hypothetical protein
MSWAEKKKTHWYVPFRLSPGYEAALQLKGLDLLPLCTEMESDTEGAQGPPSKEEMMARFAAMHYVLESIYSQKAENGVSAKEEGEEDAGDGACASVPRGILWRPFS